LTVEPERLTPNSQFKEFIMQRSIVLHLIALIAIISSGSVAWADGTEVLDTPSIAIANGTGVASAGTGLISQPSSIDIEVPAGASIEQVLLYWEGFMRTNVPGDDTIEIGGIPVVGTLIGGPAFFFSKAYASTYRADITALGLVSAGMNSVSVTGLDYTRANNGAGLLVIFDDGSTNSTIGLRDGLDLAFDGFPSPRDTTVPQTFSFAPAASDRIANLDLFFASVAGSESTGTLRPSVIEVTVEGPGINVLTTFDNVLDSNSGDEWDAFKIAIDLPADADTLTIQAFSRDDLGTGERPASFDWVAAALSVEPEEPPGVPGRMTGGGSVFKIDGTRVTRGFEIHCDLREPNNIQVNWPGNRFHMTDLTGAVCIDTAVDQLPRSAPFDTFQGEGTGKLNGEEGARIEFVFVDAGEPGRDDTAEIRIFDQDDNEVLFVSGNLDRGNMQAHKDNKSTL
jgi:hypothetical protein